jgi:hypothetical protein
MFMVPVTVMGTVTVVEHHGNNVKGLSPDVIY